MIDRENSISLAIYEYFSNPENSATDHAVKKQYEISKAVWTELIGYGITTNEFQRVNPESVFHVIVFAYQGVRMYSRLMNIDPGIPAQITREIKRLLLPEKE